VTAAVLIVVLHGLAPMQVRTFASLAECEHARVLVFVPTASSTTRYRCVAG
jgi:hypothetical protein